MRCISDGTSSKFLLRTEEFKRIAMRSDKTDNVQAAVRSALRREAKKAPSKAETRIPEQKTMLGS
jgi:hypothetical protein